MFPLFSKIYRAKAEFYNSVGVLSRFLGPWSYIADVCQKYFGGSWIPQFWGGVINQRLGLGEIVFRGTSGRPFGNACNFCPCSLPCAGAGTAQVEDQGTRAGTYWRKALGNTPADRTAAVSRREYASGPYGSLPSPQKWIAAFLCRGNGRFPGDEAQLDSLRVF